jgi:hypothetical protein
VEPNERITAEQSMKEPWIISDKVPTIHRKNTLEKLAEFNARRKLKGAVFTIFAVKRMQEYASP